MSSVDTWRAARLTSFFVGILVVSGLCLGQTTQFRPQLLRQASGEAAYYSLAIDPDGSWVAAGSSLNGTVAIFERASGQLLRVLTIATEGETSSGRQVYSLAVSHDGKLIASVSSNSLATVWETETSKRIWSHFTDGTFVAFDAENHVALGWTMNSVRIYDIRSNHEVGDPFSWANMSAWCEHAAFSPDGKTLVTGHKGGVVSIWDVASRQMVRSFHAGNWASALAVSPDGARIAVGTKDRQLSVWDLKTASDNDPKSKLQTLVGHSAEVSGVAFDPKQPWRLVSCGGMSDGSLHVWDLRTSQQIRSMSMGQYAAPSGLAFDPKGEWVAAVHGDVRRWNPDDGAETTPDRSASTVAQAEFDKTWRWMISYGAHDVRVWDVRAGQMAREFALSPEAEIWWSEISPDDGRVTAGFVPARNGPFQIRTWSVATGQELSTSTVTPPLPYGFFTTALSPDHSLIGVAKRDDKQAVLWDTRTGKQIRTIALPSGFSAIDLSGNRLGFSARSKWLYALSQSELTVWNRATGSVVLKEPVNQGYGELILEISPDERWLVMLTNHSHELAIFELGSRAPAKRVTFHAKGVEGADGPDVHECHISPRNDLIACHTGESIETFRAPSGVALPTIDADFDNQRFGFTPDGKIILNDSRRGLVQTVDPESRTEAVALACSDCGLADFTFSPTGEYVAAMDRGIAGPVRLFDKTGARLADITLFRNTPDWLVTAPDGLFDGSPGGWRQVYWRFSDRLSDVQPVESFFTEYFYPGLIGDLLAGQRPKASADLAAKDRRQPVVTVSADSVQDRIASVEIRANGRDGIGVRDVRLFRNGSLVKAWRGEAALDANGYVTLKARVQLTAGKNSLSAYAFNHDNVKSVDAESSLDVAGAPRRGTLRILSIGINHYSNETLNLKYAVPDSAALASELASRQETLQRFQKVEVIPLADEKATRQGIEDSLAQLARRVLPEDVVIIFFAGHGLADGSRFYLVPHDVGPTSQLEADGVRKLIAHAISDIDLERALEPIDAASIALIIDACNSGQALEADEKRRGPMNSAGLAQLAYEKGMPILTAAKSYQAALETTPLGHGLLTYALVEEGLKKGEADTSPRDGIVLLREWFDFATTRVPQLSIDAAKSRGVASDRTPAAQEPRVFYRREPEKEPLVVAKLPGSSR